MIYAINILQGIDGLDFGSSADETRKFFSGKFESYVIGGSLDRFKNDFPTDYYNEIGVFCYFDKNGKFEAIEFVKPSRPTMKEIDLLSLSAKDAVDLFRRMDPNLDINATRALSRELSIGFVFSYEDDGADAIIESFLLGCPGYYNDV